MGGDEVETVSSSSDDIQLIQIQRVSHNNGSFSGPLNQRVGRKSPKKLNFSNSSSAIDLSHNNKDENVCNFIKRFNIG
jgi:hypothetical protein